MSLLSTYRSRLTEELGTSETVFFTNTKRDNAINQACRWVGNSYKVPDLIIQEDVTFTSGVGTIPSRFAVANLERFYDSDTNSTFTFYKDPNEFDFAGRGVCIDYDVDTADRVLLVKPTSITTLRLRYFQMTNPMTDSTINSGLPPELDIAIAKYAAQLLLQQKGNFDEAAVMRQAAVEEVRYWANTFADDSGVMTSVFDGSDYLNDIATFNRDNV